MIECKNTHQDIFPERQSDEAVGRFVLFYRKFKAILNRPRGDTTGLYRTQGDGVKELSAEMLGCEGRQHVNFP